MRISFIGGGVMGEALIKSILAKGVAAPKDITVSDVSQRRRELLARQHPGGQGRPQPGRLRHDLPVRPHGR